MTSPSTYCCRVVTTRTRRSRYPLHAGLVAVVFASLGLAACGGGDEDEVLASPPPALSAQDALIRRMAAPDDSAAQAAAQPASAPAVAH